MSSVRFAWLSLLPVFAAVLSPVSAAPTHPASVIARRVSLSPATPLDQIPLYSLDPSSPSAMRKLEGEIDRLYRYATTLPSGPERRSLERRIYQLEKQFHPLLKSFDAEVWKQLRELVKNEWISVQATLVADTEAEDASTAGAPLASTR